MIKVIIESPFAGDTDRNILYARRLVADCLQRNEAPIASHLLYTQPGILDDTKPDERKLGIKAGLVWGASADLTVVGNDYGMTKGMIQGVKRANAEGRLVEFRSIGKN